MSLTSEEYIKQLSAELGKLSGMLPLGFEYVRLTGQTPHPGGVDYMGQESTRAMYADLWAWLNKHKPDAIISEDEWQTLYVSQNGNVAKYSTGDGSTTFRFPRVVGYFKGAESVDELGQYIKEGLPNITGRLRVRSMVGGGNVIDAIGFSSNAFTWTSDGDGTTFNNALDNTSDANLPVDFINIDASLSNPIYGNSQHVTPETVTVVTGVIAFGSVASIGEATEEGIVAELGEHGAKLGELESDVANAVPAGFVMPFAANSDPEGFLLCNGAEVSRTTYAALFTAVGVTYGSGDGTATFNLPNLTDRFIQGSGTAGTVKDAGLPNITGTVPSTRAYNATGAFYKISGTGYNHSDSLGGNSIGFDASLSNSIYGNSDTVQPPALTMRYYIKY